MITADDATLAQLSLIAYAPPPVIPGFVAAPLNIALDPTASYANGLFTDQNAAALVQLGTVDGQLSLILAFRGSDDTQDSINDLQGINADYAKFSELFTAIDQFLATGLVKHVAVTGHSLGGALAQVYMAQHPDAGGITYRAETFGSPGAQIADAPDARIENVVIGDDPAVFLGVHRGEIGPVLQSDPGLAQQAANAIAAELPGITPEQALATLPALTANYVNRGGLDILPTDTGQFGVAAQGDLLQADATRHDPVLYWQLTSQVAAGLTREVGVAETATGSEAEYYRAVYGGEYPPGVNVQGFVTAFAGDYVAARNAVAEARNDVRDFADDAGDAVTGTYNDVANYVRNDLFG